MFSSLASFAMLIRSGDKSLFSIACLRSALYCAMVVSFFPIYVVWVGVTTILTVGGPSKDDKNKNNIVVTLEDGYEFISNEGLKHKAFHNIEDIHLETTKSKVRKI